MITAQGIESVRCNEIDKPLVERDRKSLQILVKFQSVREWDVLAVGPLRDYWCFFSSAGGGAICLAGQGDLSRDRSARFEF